MEAGRGGIRTLSATGGVAGAGVRPVVQPDRGSDRITNLASENPRLDRKLFGILNDQVARGRSTPGPDLKNDVPRIRIHNRMPGFVLKK